MADFTDVANTLVGVIAGIVYPNGTGQPSIVNAPVKVFQGWPLPNPLEEDLKKGKLNISVWPTPTENVLPSRLQEWQTLSIADPTITLTSGDGTVTVSGTGAAGQNAAVMVDNQPYVYAVQGGDTSETIAAALAALISVDRPATSAGSVLTVPDTHSIVARVGTTGISIRELRRQEKLFQISIWADCHERRDPVASAIDIALAETLRLALPDGSQGILRYRSSNQIDNTQKNGIYRRDLMYAVEYSTTQTRTDTQIVSEKTSISVVPLTGGAPVGQVIINS
jgi:hypothetical protein